MAEHVRHALVRNGFAERPSRVQTLARFADDCGAPPAAPAFLVHRLIEEALEKLRPARFERVREFAGVHAELAQLLEDIPDAAAVGDRELAEVFRNVEARLEGGGFGLRSSRLRAAARNLRSGATKPPRLAIFDGFFTLRAGELDLIRALAECGGVMVTLPAGATIAGFEVERIDRAGRRPERVLFSAASPEREAEEIARRILEEAGRGRPFREMGVVLRSREPYERLIGTTLARFGIPVRSYFLDTLGTHPAVQYLAGIVRALLQGWDHAAINTLLRMPASGVGATPEGDRFDFALREALPGRGLPMGGIREQPALLGELQKLNAWRRQKLEPAEWAVRLAALAGLVARPAFGMALDREEVNAARSTEAALRKFAEVAAQAAAFSGAGTIALEEVWKRVETALAVEHLPAEDRRRDVVHLMDVFEARQWELPVVFVCGLVERAFPKYHGENPVLGDAARRRLGLQTSADLEAQERALFDMAATRATAQAVFSYPRFDERGEETLRSFFLNGLNPGVDLEERRASRVRPMARREVGPVESGPVQIAASKHARLSASSIEDFLQCPFKFFARKTLKLQQRPAAPRDRLDVLTQGIILHRALAEYWRAPLLGIGVLDQVFERECAQKRVPRTYRTEAVRLELLRHFERFAEDRQVELGWDARVEEEFEFELGPGLTIRGRIDRLEVNRASSTDRRQALVIDYKYSTQVKGRVKETESGGLVQAGLYLLAAERAFGLDPVGMLYCGLKGEVAWEGWHGPLPALEGVGTSTTREAIRELMAGAEQKAMETREGILAGRVEAHPADQKKCDWCDFRDICRVETTETERASGAGG